MTSQERGHRSTATRYYLSASGTLYRHRGHHIDLFTTWGDGWMPLLLPRRHIGPWRRISAVRARLSIWRRQIAHWRYERAVGAR